MSRPSDDFIVIDLFCGAGGFSAGVHQSGNRVALAIDADAHMLSLHHMNNPDTKHVLMELGGDVAEFGSHLLNFVGTRTWHLHGSPPCQSFSIANRMNGNYKEIGDDKRCNLSYWFLDLVRWVQESDFPPRSWSMEQVPTAKKFVEERHPWVRQEPNVHYDVYGWQFGAPTLRRRMFKGSGWTLVPIHIQTGKRKRGENPQMPCVADLIQPPYDLPASKVAIRGAKNNFSKVKGELKNRKVRSELGENLRTFEEPCYSILASQALQVWTRDDVQEDSTILWRKRGNLCADDAKLIQGFPPSYKVEVPSTQLVAYPSMKALLEGQPDPVKTLKIAGKHKVKAIGNSVVPMISANLFQNLVQ